MEEARFFAGGEVRQVRPDRNGLTFCEPKDREVWLATASGIV